VNAINHALNAVFDALLWPLELLGRPAALVLASAVAGVLALLLFKQLSFQKRIRAVKDRIQAHLIEIRIYQDDLRITARAITRVLARNFQYLALNLLPFIPLSLPFAIVLAQLVVRYGFGPTPVTDTGAHALPGATALVRVELERESAALAGGLRLELPAGVEARSPLVRLASEGVAFQEVLVRAPGEHVLVVVLADGTRETKRIAGGVNVRAAQPERAKGVLHALLWPAEDALASASPLASISATQPDSELGWLPGGPGGVVLVFLVASLVAGALAIKPLKVTI